MLNYLFLTVVVIFVLYILARLKETDKVNKKAYEDNQNALKEATELRRESLKIQKEILAELQAMWNERT